MKKLTKFGLIIIKDTNELVKVNYTKLKEYSKYLFLHYFL